MIRPRTVVAIAHRDLSAEFAGRRWGVPLIAALLLAPVALVPVGSDSTIEVQGDVPPSVLAIPNVKRGGGIGFRADDRMRVYAFQIPEPVRDALDEGAPVIRVEQTGRRVRMPSRSMLFALISASTLTGAVSGSIGGERSRRTLQALLSAAVSRLEIVLGKWLAWAGFGVSLAMMAAIGALVAGRIQPGTWLLALPTVPALTVALGLWLVRRSDDVIAGTSASLRVLPAVIGGAGALALFLSAISDLAAAAVPLGGALLVAGDLWPGNWGIAAVATVSTVSTTIALLYSTARDLEQRPSESAPSAWLPTLRLGFGAALTWWTLVAGPILWGWAGNPKATDGLPTARGLIAASTMLGMFGLTAWAESEPGRPQPTIGSPRPSGIFAGIAVYLSMQLPGLTSTNPWLQLVSERFAMGIQPTWVLAPLVIGVQEWIFRGWLQTRGGIIGSALLWTLAVSPHAPLTGLMSGLVLGWSARQGIGNAWLARLTALFLQMSTIP